MTEHKDSATDQEPADKLKIEVHRQPRGKQPGDLSSVLQSASGGKPSGTDTFNEPAMLPGRQRRFLLILSLVSAVLLLGLVIYWSWSNGLWGRSGRSRDFSSAAAPQSLALSSQSGSALNTDRLQLNLGAALQTTNGLLTDSRWLDVRSAKFYKSDDPTASSENAALYLLYLAETGGRSNFFAELAVLQKNLQLPSGLLAERTSLADAAFTASELAETRDPADGDIADLDTLQASDNPDYYATLIYCRALALAYLNWGNQSLYQDLETCSAAYLAACQDGLPPLSPQQITVTPTPGTYFEAGEGPDAVTPTATPTPAASQAEQENQSIALIELDTIDLQSLQLLAEWNSDFEPIYQSSLKLLQGALLDGSLPLYQQGYNPEYQTYITYGLDNKLDLTQSLKIALSLSEAGQKPTATIAWLKASLRGANLVDSYDYISQTTLSDTLSPLNLGLICRLARYVSDQDLYDYAISDLTDGQIGTVSGSPAYGLIFRQPKADGNVVLTSQDNVWALLGCS
ncbi:hypothetical protein HCH52_11900 [Oscillospiraceae bacterium HV4-5-C5C]|nr:hypothetical protein [Oscillospiraceae bacterium HV4-5-C5C]